MQLDNPNPLVKVVRKDDVPVTTRTLQDKVFDVIRDIRDPEHDHSLEALAVVDRSSIVVTEPEHDSPGYGHVTVTFTPTVPHCSMASVIGLSIKAKIAQSRILLGPGEIYYKLSVECEKDSHNTADGISKQLADKERVSAAFENPNIVAMIDSCVNNLPQL